MTRLNDAIEKSSSSVDDLIMGQSSDYLIKIFRWISPLAGVFVRKQLDMFSLKGQQDGIGEWLLKTDEFNDWILGNGKVFWCPEKRNVPYLLPMFFVIKRSEEV